MSLPSSEARCAPDGRGQIGNCPVGKTRRVFGERQCRRFDIAPAFGRVDAFAPTGYRSGHLGRSQRYPKLIQVHRVGILVPHSAQVLDQILLAGLSEGQAVDG